MYFEVQFETANERVLEKAAEDEELSGMGTTVVAATVVENYLYVANVGEQQTVSDTGSHQTDHQRPLSGRERWCGRVS